MYLKQASIFLFVASLLLQCKYQDKVKEIDSENELDGMQQVMHQQFMMTRDPSLNTIPNERLKTARAYMESLTANNRTTQTAALAWQERGPNNVGGRTRAILVDKRDATGNTVFAGSVSGGMFKTTNFTSPSCTWTVINDFLPNLAITSIVQDNNNPDIMYAGTGEGWFNAYAQKGEGIFKSTDGGVTWNVLPSTLITTPADSTYEYVQDLAIDNNGNLYTAIRNILGAARGVRRSTDGGASWTQVLGAPLTNPVTFTTGRAADLEVASNGDVYATLGVDGKGSVWKSSFATNGASTGALGTWVDITPPWVRTRLRIELAIAPSNSQRLYVIAQDSTTDGVLGLYRSFNAGSTWDSIGAPNAIDFYVVSNSFRPQAWYDLIMAVDPNNPDILIAGGINLAKSIDAGVNWTTISNENQAHVDHHFLQYVGSNKLIDGNDGGIYYSEDINVASPSFAVKNSGYNVTQFYACDYHPTNTNYFLAGAQDNRTQKFAAAGINSTTVATGGDGGFCHIDQTDGQIQITSNTSNNFFRSTNGGTSFSFVGSVSNDRGQFINPTDYDDNANILYCGDDPGKYYFVSGWGTTPVGAVASVSIMGSREVTAVKIDPFSANTIWIGASYGTPTAVPPQVYKVSNANNTSPTVLTIASIGNQNGASISSIDVDPSNANHILVTLSNYGVVSVWESTDGGSVFTSIEGDLPDMPIYWGIFAPTNAQLNGSGGGNGGILLATALGVWTTSQINGSSTAWIPNKSGLANVPTMMLKFRPSDNLVAAATYGRGLFTTILPTVVTGLPNIPVTKDFIRYISAESGQLQIVVGTLSVKTMTIQVYDMNGRLVDNRQNQYQNSVVNIQQLSTGSYVVKITGDKKENFVQQFIKR